MKTKIKTKMKGKIIMQCFIPDAIRAEIAKLQTELRMKGVTKRASCISAVYIALVEAGVERYPNIDNLPDKVHGRKRINIPFSPDTRVAIAVVASTLRTGDRQAVNILAWRGLESFTQYVHALEYPIAPAKKIGRPRKQKEAAL